MTHPNPQHPPRPDRFAGAFADAFADFAAACEAEVTAGHHPDFLDTTDRAVLHMPAARIGCACGEVTVQRAEAEHFCNEEVRAGRVPAMVYGPLGNGRVGWFLFSSASVELREFTGPLAPAPALFAADDDASPDVARVPQIGPRRPTPPAPNERSSLALGLAIFVSTLLLCAVVGWGRQ